MKLKRNQMGLSFTSLAVIVIIVALAIFLFVKLKDIFLGDKFTKFKNDYEDFDNKLRQDYLYRKTKGLTQQKDAKFYYEIANGVSISDDTKIEPTGTIEKLGIDMNPSQLNGTEFYEIKKDSNISGVTGKKKFYESSEKHYVTNNGEIFILPGYKHEEEGVTRWYVTSKKYYESETPIKDIKGADIGEAKILTDVTTGEEAGENLKKGVSLYITFDATLNGEKLQVEPSLPFEVTSNGTYTFQLTSSGRVFRKSVTVNNYREKNPTDVLKIGDYVEYTADSKSYRTSKDHTGDVARTILTEKKNWRVLYIDKVTQNVFITTDGPVNENTYLSGTIGYVNGTDTLNEICKELYSNNKLKLVARSMSLDDINQFLQPEIPEDKVRYAYYPRGTSVKGTSQFEGNVYTNATNEWRVSRFYESDGGGEESTDNNGLTYREAKEDKPVYVTQSFYEYKTDFKDGSALKSILGSKKSWIASKCTYAKATGAGIGIRTISANELNADILYDSYSNTYNIGNALHPVIEIESSQYTFDFDSKQKNGSTPEKAWKFTKEM